MINRKATYNYEILLRLTAGMILTGKEVKALRDSKGNITTSHCVFSKGELFLTNCSIGEEPIRLIKLLLNKNELEKVSSILETNQGTTIIPLVITVKKLIKIDIAVCRGKKNYDKRESIKKRDVDRQNKREL